MFFDALSNEHELAEGKLYIRGKVSHFDLNRFELLDETFQENIILNSFMNIKKFDKICLVIDLNFNDFIQLKYHGRV